VSNKLLTYELLITMETIVYDLIDADNTVGLYHMGTDTYFIFYLFIFNSRLRSHNTMTSDTAQHRWKHTYLLC